MVRLLLLVFVSLLAREVSAVSQEMMNFYFEQSVCIQPVELDVCDNVDNKCKLSACCNGEADVVGVEEGVCVEYGDLPVIALGEACNSDTPCAGICDKTNGEDCVNSVCAVPFAGPFFCACTSDDDCNAPDETCQTLGGVNRVESWCFNAAKNNLPPEPSADTLEGDVCAIDLLGKSTCGEDFECTWDTHLCKGLAAVGEDCQRNNANCLSGWCLEDSTGSACQEVAVGTACDGVDGDTTSCQGTACWSTVPNTCVLSCYNSVCEMTLVALGDDCSLGQECDAGTYCTNGSPRICAAQFPAGQACTGGDFCESGLCEGNPSVCTAIVSPVSGAACDYLSTSTLYCMEGESCNNVDSSGTGVCEVLTACDYHIECGSTEKCVQVDSYGSGGFCISEGLAVAGESCDSSQTCAVGLACIMTYFEPDDALDWKTGVCGAFGSGDADGDACQIARGVDAVCGGPYFWDYTDSCNDGSVCMMSGSSASGVVTTFECSKIAAVASGCSDDGYSEYYKTSDMNGLCTDKKIGSPCKASDWEHTSMCDDDLETYCDIPVSDAANNGGIGVCAQGPLLEGDYCFANEELCGDSLDCDDDVTGLCIDVDSTAGLAEGETCVTTKFPGDRGDCAFPLMCSCVGSAGELECVNEYDNIPEAVDPFNSKDLCAAEAMAKWDYIGTQCSEGGPLDLRTAAQKTCGNPHYFDHAACHNDLDQDALDGYDVAMACCWVCRHTDTLTTLSDLTVALKDYGSSVLFRDFGSIVDCSAGTITRALEFDDFCTDLDISDVFLNCPTYSSTGSIVFNAGTRATHFGMLVGAVLAVGAYGVAQ